MIPHRHNERIFYDLTVFRVFGIGDMTVHSDQRSDFGAGQLALWGVAVIVLLVFAWSFVY